MALCGYTYLISDFLKTVCTVALRTARTLFRLNNKKKSLHILLGKVAMQKQRRNLHNYIIHKITKENFLFLAGCPIFNNTFVSISILRN